MADNLQVPLTNEEQQFDEDGVSLQAEMIVTSLSFPMVFKAALELGVIDTIATTDEGVWLSPYDIALGLPTKPTNPEAPALLDRMLVLLASHSVLKCRMVETGENVIQTAKTQRVYAAEPVCKFFLNRGDRSGSFASAAMVNISEVFFKTWTHLKDVILEGKDAFSSAHGMKLFEYLDSDKQFADIFNRAMSGGSARIMKKVVEVYKGFEDINILVDVGGGIGTNIGLVTSRYPHIKGINFDLASVLSHAPIHPGVEHVSGDMFTEIPKGDAIFMKWILHDWTDEDCIKILKNCWKSLPEKGKVIMVDWMKPEKPIINDVSSNIVFSMDMMMLTQFSGGKERSFSQLDTLASASGFLHCEIMNQVYSNYIIEFHK